VIIRSTMARICCAMLQEQISGRGFGGIGTGGYE
jgi:hypothetical protein